MQKNNKKENQDKIYESSKCVDFSKCKNFDEKIPLLFDSIETVSELIFEEFLRIRDYFDFPKINLKVFHYILDSYSLAGQLNSNQLVSFMRKIYKLNLNLSNDISPIAFNLKQNSDKNIINVKNLSRRNSSINFDKNVFIDHSKEEKIENHLNHSIDIINNNYDQQLPRFNNNLNLDSNDKNTRNDNNGSETKSPINNIFNEKDNLVNVSIENLDKKLDCCFSETENLAGDKNKFEKNIINDNQSKHDNNNISEFNNNLLSNLTIKDKENKNEEYLSCNISMSKDDNLKENKDYIRSGNNVNFTTPFKKACENISSFIPQHNNNNLTLSFNSYLLSNNQNNKNLIGNLKTNSCKKFPNNFENNNAKYLKNKTIYETNNLIKRPSSINTGISEKISNLLKFFQTSSMEVYIFDEYLIFSCLSMFFDAELEDRVSTILEIFKNNEIENKDNKISYDELVYFLYNFFFFILYFSRELENREVEKFSINSDECLVKNKSSDLTDELNNNMNTQGSYMEKLPTEKFENQKACNLEKLNENYRKKNPTKKENFRKKIIDILLKKELLQDMCEYIVDLIYVQFNIEYNKNLEMSILIEYFESFL